MHGVSPSPVVFGISISCAAYQAAGGAGGSGGCDMPNRQINSLAVEHSTGSSAVPRRCAAWADERRE